MINTSFVKIAAALLALIQMASAFAPNVLSTSAITTSLNAEPKVTGIGGLVGGIEIVGVDKIKSKSVRAVSSKPKVVAKKAGGFKLPVFTK